MCECGGELTVWCFVCGDYVCDDCGCPADHDVDGWDYVELDDHDERHPYWHEGCDDCVERANWLEAQHRDTQRSAS